MYFIAELSGVITEVLLVHLYLRGLFDKKNRPWWALGISYTAFGLILMLLSFIPDISFLRLFFYAGAIVAIIRFYFSAKLTQTIFASISMCGLYVLSEMLVIGLFSMAHIDAQTIMSYGNSRAACIIISHLLLWLCVLIVLAMTRNKRSAITMPFLLALSPGYVAGIFLGVSFCRQVTLGEDFMQIPVLVSAIGLLYLNILIILYAERAKNASDQRLEAELAEHHYAMQEQYYVQLRSDQEETRAMFHDINKSLQAMRALVSEGNAGEANQVLVETQELFGGLGAVVDVGNSVVSVILNEYKQLAADANVSLSYDVSVPQNLGLTAVDLYVILGNTLDNALEACASLPVERREIKLQLRKHRNMLFYQIENPYSPEHITRKKNGKHGYGLTNVQKCVDKYSGRMSVSRDNGQFVLSACLNINLTSS